MSLYKQAHFAQPSCHLVRYTPRTDGFTSVHAPFVGGEFVTKPVTFTGRELVVNFSNGAAGRLEGGTRCGSLAGNAVRLRFVMQDADLYSLRFR